MDEDLPRDVKGLIILECLAVCFLVWCSFVYLPYRINLIIFIVIFIGYIIFQSYYQQTYSKGKAFTYFGVVLITLAVIMSMTSAKPVYISQGDAYDGEFSHNVNSKEFQGETFIFITTEQRNKQGFTNIQGSVRFPSDGFVYQKKIVSTTNIKYTLNFESTLKFTNLTVFLYSKNSTTESSQKFITSKLFALVQNGTKIVDNVNTTIWKISTDFYVDFTPENNLAYVHFYFNVSLDVPYYQNALIYQAQSWLRLTSIPFSALEEWGYTTTLEYSLDGIINDPYLNLPFWMGIFIGLFLVVYLLGFLTQSAKIIKTFFFLEVVLGVIILFTYLGNADQSVPLVRDLIPILDEAANTNNVLIPDWFREIASGLAFVMRIFALIYWIFLWACSIGIALYLCFLLMEMTTAFSITDDLKKNQFIEKAVSG